MEKIKFTTKDGVDIAGLWWNAKSQKTALLFHMMPATKKSWLPFAEALFRKGCNALAVDFRGHGESGGGDYKMFTSEQHRSYILDAHAAVHFIRERQDDIMPDMVLAGASIGANIALRVSMEYEWIERVLLLSAGLDYHGVNIGEDIRVQDPANYAVKPYFVTSRDDADNAQQSALLHGLYGGSLTMYDTGGHGTDIFKTHPELLGASVEYLLSRG